MLKFKKHALALAAGALFAAPAAFADATTTEGIIYQADQTDAVANINQVQTEGVPQAAAIIQIDNQHAGLDSLNIGTVIQGAVPGDNQNVTIDPTGASATSTTTDAFGAAGLTSTGGFVQPFVTDLSAYIDDNGTTPYQYTVQGTTSSNYGLILQDGQQNSQAIIIQAQGLEVDNAIAAQNTLTNGDIPANADATTASATAGGSFDLLTQNYNGQSGGQNAVELVYGDGTLTIDLGNGAIDLGASADSLGIDRTIAPEGNLAIITQGADFSTNSLTTANGGTIDLADSEAGSGDVTNNVAAILQVGTNGYASIGQQGSLSTAIIVQAGDSNYAESYQYESELGGSASLEQFSVIAQAGNFNIAQVYQAGAFNSSYVFQLGDGNLAQVDQLTDPAGASGAISFIYQSNAAAGGAFGTGNYASVYQHAAL